MGILDTLLKRKKQDDPQKILPVLPKDIYEAGVLELKDVLAPSALKITPRELNLGDKIVRTFFVISYPRFIPDNWLSPIINLDKVFDISISIIPVETTQALKDFRKRVAEVQSQIHMREEKGLVRDPVLDSAYQNLESLRDQLQQATEKLFDVGLYISIYANDQNELDKLESEIRSVLESRLIYLKPALFQQEQGFQSILPIQRDELSVHSKLNTSPLSSFFPFVSFDLTSDKGILYGINRHNSSLTLFDRFSLPNYNSVTFATSGAGKSYAVKLEILRTLMFDTEVLVIDPEREYEFMAEAMGGRYFNISLTSEHHINPFDLPPVGPDETPTNVLRSHIVTLVGLFRIIFGDLTPEEDAIIDRAITETYALKDITGEADFSSSQPPLLSDFELVLAGMEGAESLVQRLTKYTKGTWSGFINNPSNVDINKKFVVFSVRDMEDELKPVAMYLITHYIWSAVRKNIRKRLLVVDEAWWMMKSEDTASLLFGLAKRGRKYYLGIATITQDVGDFLRSPYGLPIITNSSIQVLLKQSPTAIDLVQRTFNLTDEEKYLLLESEVGEGIFFAGLKHVAIKIIASYTEDQIITSDPSEVLAIKKARQEFRQSREQAVDTRAEQTPTPPPLAGHAPLTPTTPPEEERPAEERVNFPEQPKEQTPAPSAPLNETPPEQTTHSTQTPTPPAPEQQAQTTPPTTNPTQPRAGGAGDPQPQSPVSSGVDTPTEMSEQTRDNGRSLEAGSPAAAKTSSGKQKMEASTGNVVEDSARGRSVAEGVELKNVTP